MTAKLGVAILGTGGVSGEHIRAYQQNPHTEVVALLSRQRARAEAKAREYGLADCRAFTDLRELLADERVRIVSICTPHQLHVEQGVACAEAGRHILMEKPMALELAGVRALDAAVRQAGVKSLVSFVLRWNPLFETIRAMLAQRLIGQLFYAEVDYMHDIGPSYSGYEWIHKKECGNNLLTAGCHAVDAIRWFVGGEVVEVFAYGNIGPRNRLRYEYITNSVTALKFAGGAIGKVGCSIECVMPYRFNILLLGEEGTIRNNEVFTERWPGQKGWAAIPTVMPDSAAVTHHPFVGEIDHFVDCILSGRESHCNIADAVATHEICLATEISARENRPVKLPLGF
ncbi:MAG: Gfo/Idh/MocA family oxidoreductase [Acidobacteriota bacterium]